VGHDWGGVVAWNVPVRAPEMVERLIVLNAPHPAAFARALRGSSQLLRSWYVYAFQAPLLPELSLSAFNVAMLGRLLRTDPVHRDAFTEADIRRYKRALGRPGALTAAINYYRAAVRRNPADLLRDPGRIEQPTLLIWGEQDRALGRQLTERLEQWVPNIRVERIPDAGHWVQNDVPARVNELMLGFLRQ
jgi:pimeloyl-ACP methyl ester carboxylesterase